MKVRKFDPETNDMVTSGRTILKDAEAVAAVVRHRLRLFVGEYPFNIEAGTDWFGRILGKKEQYEREAELKRVISNTENVISLSYFDVTEDPDERKFSVRCGIITPFGEASIEELI